MNDPLTFAALCQAEKHIQNARHYAGGIEYHAQAKTYTRRLIAETLNLDITAAFDRWGMDAPDSVSKAAVGATLLSEIDPDAAGILGLVMERSIVGRIQNLRRIPFFIRMTKITSGALAHWVSEGAPRPMSRLALDGDTLSPLTLSALIALTKESLYHVQSEQVATDDLVRALVAVLDAQFTSDDAGVADTTPAGIAVGAPTITSTGDIANDLESLMETYTGDLLSSSIICTPSTALRLALKSGGNPQISLGPNGGDLFGIPVLTTRNLGADSNGQRLLLVDASGVLANVEAIRVSKSAETSLAMADNPSSPAQMVSMFQTGTVAFLAEITANWNVARDGSVAVIEGI